ncbi:MAG TPA: sigma factor-like helix-turn-helix DNA-binding protein [Rhodanobacteraceae bacterium]|nr:sigma factor-like helix-turn-helix DNA-binding protein [Rhodanobacteraceae bacterium]
MLSSSKNRDPTRIGKSPAEPSPARDGMDLARRGHYLTLLRRWAQERLPTGTRAAADAAEWIRDALSRSGNTEREAEREGRSPLVKLRTLLLAGRPQPLRARLAERAIPSSRVEQLIGCDQLDAWENALATLPRRQRELVILRVEFGLDFEAIAAEMHLALPFARAETVNALAALIDALGGTPRGRAA